MLVTFLSLANIPFNRSYFYFNIYLSFVYYLPLSKNSVVAYISRLLIVKGKNSL